MTVISYKLPASGGTLTIRPGAIVGLIEDTIAHFEHVIDQASRGVFDADPEFQERTTYGLPGDLAEPPVNIFGNVIIPIEHDGHQLRVQFSINKFDHTDSAAKALKTIQALLQVLPVPDPTAPARPYEPPTPLRQAAAPSTDAVEFDRDAEHADGSYVFRVYGWRWEVGIRKDGSGHYERVVALDIAGQKISALSVFVGDNYDWKRLEPQIRALGLAGPGEAINGEFDAVYRFKTAANGKQYKNFKNLRVIRADEPYQLSTGPQHRQPPAPPDEAPPAGSRVESEIPF